MKAIKLLPLLLLAAFSCQKPLFPGTPRWMRMQDRYKYLEADGPSAPDSAGSPLDHRPVVYMTALRFPEGVDWRNGEREGARLVLWKDGEEVLDLPGGHYPEPDRHRVRGGHLWQDDSDGSVTRIFLDGEEILQYEGDEILRGLLLEGEDLHTLGQRVGGEGFSYRINGEEVYSHPLGRISGTFEDREWEGGALMQDGDGVYYSCALPIRKENAVSWEHRLMKGDELVLKITETEAKTVFDIRVWNGSVYRSEQRGDNSGSFMLVKDQLAHALGSGLEGQTVHLCRLVPDGKQMLVKGYSSKNSLYSYWFRGTDGPSGEIRSSFLLADLYLDNPLLAAISLDKGLVRNIYDGEKNLNLPARKYALRTKACSAYKDGVLYAVLTDMSGDGHLLLKGDEFETFTFNGCFTGIWIE